MKILIKEGKSENFYFSRILERYFFHGGIREEEPSWFEIHDMVCSIFLQFFRFFFLNFGEGRALSFNRYKDIKNRLRFEQISSDHP